MYWPKIRQILQKRVLIGARLVGLTTRLRNKPSTTVIDIFFQGRAVVSFSVDFPSHISFSEFFCVHLGEMCCCLKIGSLEGLSEIASVCRN